MDITYFNIIIKTTIDQSKAYMDLNFVNFLIITTMIIIKFIIINIEVNSKVAFHIIIIIHMDPLTCKAFAYKVTYLHHN